jgi:hypothetical protein
MRSIIMGRPGHVKLSMDKARDVRRRLAAGESIVAIAAAHGVNEKTIWKIKHNRAWLEQSVNASVFTWSGTLKEAA